MKFRDVPITANFLRKSNKQVVAVIPIHQRDADLYLDQLMAEITRLDWDATWHLNGLAPEVVVRIANWPRTVGYSLARSNDPFVDIDRNYALKMAMESGAPWISPHDADETLEPNAPEILKELLKTPAHIVTKWYNIWKVDSEGLHIRMDGQFFGYKARFYHTGGYKYCYRMNSASVYPDKGYDWPPRVDSGLRILHWGFSTPESRLWHFNRWDGKINSSYWKGLVDPVMALQCSLQVFDPNLTHDEFYGRYLNHG